jgi:nucleoside-diphosphate-sugar epimerase
MRRVVIAGGGEDIQRAGDVHVEDLARVLIRIWDRDHRAEVVNLVHAAHSLGDSFGIPEIAEDDLDVIQNFR